ncbi:exosortase C-terminal domain/associated protein EpsI [Paludibaculum fermentans]|uniref:EpsI family protein n=1 Tax=Paludibaculum fermentans TaxID=1473598 RepID=A0A7S7NYZ4_PALFE|nr:exosortase C-terminal domain/associated protein EpsI [Paludibaculum fermentans]QOY92327.1 EpsI family protein [Paludibaculum fermentans]
MITALLVVQAAALYGLSRKEITPPKPPLREVADKFPGGWVKVQEGVVEQEVRDVLQADDLLNRTYAAPGKGAVNFFIAAFETQRDGKAPHSPKNCLPGAGWMPLIFDRPEVTIPGEAAPISINRYVIQKGSSQSIVLYWYQAHNRVVASEYAAKIYLVLDAIRYNRSDTALVRVVADASDGNTEEATRRALDFVRASYPQLKPFMP